MEKPIPRECPFCGGVSLTVLEIEARQCAVNCDNCGAIGPTARNQEGAVIAWNRAGCRRDCQENANY